MLNKTVKEHLQHEIKNINYLRETKQNLADERCRLDRLKAYCLGVEDATKSNEGYDLTDYEVTFLCQTDENGMMYIRVMAKDPAQSQKGSYDVFEIYEDKIVNKGQINLSASDY